MKIVLINSLMETLCLTEFREFGEKIKMKMNENFDIFLFILMNEVKFKFSCKLPS